MCTRYTRHKCTGMRLGFIGPCSPVGDWTPLGLALPGGWFFCDAHWNEFEECVTGKTDAELSTEQRRNRAPRRPRRGGFRARSRH